MRLLQLCLGSVAVIAAYGNQASAETTVALPRSLTSYINTSSSSVTEPQAPLLTFGSTVQPDQLSTTTPLTCPDGYSCGDTITELVAPISVSVIGGMEGSSIRTITLR